MRGLRQLIILLAAVLFGVALPTTATTTEPVPAPEGTTLVAQPATADSATGRLCCDEGRHILRHREKILGDASRWQENTRPSPGVDSKHRSLGQALKVPASSK